MFPQALVQNKIISQSKDDFTLSWLAAAPILNANYFYLNRLIEESKKYRAFLRPWKEVASTNNLELHEYCTAIENNDQYGIHVGDWVGRVRKTSSGISNILNDCLVLTNATTYYVYDDITQKFVPNTAAGVPCVVRPSVWGMTTSLQISLGDERIKQSATSCQFICHSGDIQFMGNDHAIPLAYTTDAVMGRILINNQLVENVLVNINRQWNSRLIDYDFILEFPNFNFPATATVEFW